MSGEESIDELVMKEKLDRIGRIFIVMSGKGGVGKSTVAANLALSLFFRGMRTGILDVDIHGPSIPKLLGLTGMRLGVSGEEIVPIELNGQIKVVSMGLLLAGNEQAVIWRGPMKSNVIRQFVQGVNWGDLDALVVDCPPGTGDEPLSVAQLLASKGVAVVVTTPQQIATIDVEKCITFCQQLKLPIAGVVENMSGFVCPNCGQEVNIFSSGGGEKLAKQYGVPFLGSIPLDPDIVKCGDEERPYMFFYSKSKTAQKFDEIVDRIANYHVPSEKAEEEKAAAPVQPTENKKNGDGQSPTNKEAPMKFAVPTMQGKLCAHFGHCEAFALIDAEHDGTILSETYVTPPPHEPGILPPWLARQGVKYIIAGGMGSRAQQLFNQQGVQVITGAMGENPREIVEHYLKGTLETGANTCDH